MGLDTEIKKTIIFLLQKDSDIRNLIIDVASKNQQTIEHPELQKENNELAEIIFHGGESIEFKNKFGYIMSEDFFDNTTQEKIDLVFKDFYVRIDQIFRVCANLEDYGYEIKFDDLIRGAASNYNHPDANNVHFIMAVYKKK